jgi:tetratricopeptide (TPR) repeat protein
MYWRARLIFAAILTSTAIIFMAVCGGLSPVQAQDGPPPTPNTKSANAYILEGLDLYHQGLWRQALENFYTAKRLDSRFGLHRINEASGPSSLPDLYAAMSDDIFSRGGDFISDISGDYLIAVEQADQALKANHNDSAAYYHRGLAYTQLNLPGLALQDFAWAIHNNSQCAACYVARGRLYLLMQRYVSALSDFDQALSIDPVNTIAYDYRSRVRSVQNDWDGVLEDYRAIQRLDSSYPNAEVILQKIQTRAGHSFAVLIGWSFVVTLAAILGKWFLTRTPATYVHIRSLLVGEVLPLFAVLVTISVMTILIEQTGLIVSLRQRMITLLLLACAAVAPSIGLFSRMQEIRRLIGQTDYESALHKIEQWRQIPVLAWVLQKPLDRLEVSALMYSGRFEPAEQVLRQVIQQDLKNRRRGLPGDEANLGWTLLMQERYPEAIEFLREAIQRHPHEARLYTGLAEVYLTQNVEPKQALALTDLALQTNRSKHDERLARGIQLGIRAWTLALVGQQQEARSLTIQMLREADKSSQPELAGLYYRAARVWQACGDEDRLLHALNNVVALDPQGAYAPLAQHFLMTRLQNSPTAAEKELV